MARGHGPVGQELGRARCMTTSASRWTVRWRAETAAGKRGRDEVPSGAVTTTRLVSPSFWGISVPAKQRTAK